MANPRLRGTLRNSVEALSEHDFRLVFFGALVSNIGTWMQETTVPFVIYEISHNTVLVGLAVFCSTLPVAVLGPLGGAVADRVNRRRLLIGMNLLLGASAVLLAIMYAAGVRSVPPIFIVLVFGGFVNAFTVPAWSSLVPETVSRKRMSNAVTLNSAQFNAARGFGPIFGGLALEFFGPTWAFILNAISYLAVVYAILKMTRKEWNASNVSEQKVLSDLRDGFRYARTSAPISTAIPLAVMVSLLGMPVFWLMPALADKVYHSSRFGYGLMAGAIGVGTMIGVIVLSYLDSHWTRTRVMRTMLPIYAISLLLFSVTNNYVLALFFLLVTGIGFICCVSCLLNAVQGNVDNAYRSRVMAIYVLGVTVSFPVGALIQGILASHIGPQRTLTIFAGLLAAIAALLTVIPRYVARLNPTNNADPIIPSPINPGLIPADIPSP